MKPLGKSGPSVTRESLYKMLSKTGNPTYGSLTAVLQALGLKISVEPAVGTAKPGEPLAGYYRNPPIRTGIDPSPTQTASAEVQGKQRKQKTSSYRRPEDRQKDTSSATFLKSCSAGARLRLLGLVIADKARFQQFDHPR
jgi:hypothetical protein